MSITIDPEHGHEHIYFPGETVRGNITYTTTKQRKIRNASVCFRGKVDTDYSEGRRGMAGNTHGPRKREEETIRLFELKEILFRGPYDVPPQIFTWPFEFIIPINAEAGRAANRPVRLIANGMSPIPPTFNIYGVHISYEARARVKYKLVATVEKGGIFGMDELELPITISRLALNPPPLKARTVSREFQPMQRWSSHDLRRDSYSLKQKFISRFSDDPELQAPCIAFKSYVHFPLAVSASQKFPIAFSIKHSLLGPNDPEHPLLILESVKLSLNGQTVSIAGRERCQAITTVAERRLSFEPCELPLDGTEVYITNDERLSDWTGDIFGFTGDFTTYTIQYTNRLRFDVTIRHPQTNHQFQVRGEFPLEILDPHADELGIEVAGSSSGGPSSGVSRQRDVVDEDLPSYYDDIRPPAAKFQTEV